MEHRRSRTLDTLLNQHGRLLLKLKKSSRLKMENFLEFITTDFHSEFFMADFHCVSYAAGHNARASMPDYSKAGFGITHKAIQIPSDRKNSQGRRNPLFANVVVEEYATESYQKSCTSNGYL
jgi:hypothetical protein